MSNPWIKEFWRVVILGSIALVVGLAINQVLVSLLLVTLYLLAWHIYHLYHLEQWIVNRQNASPPDASGIWGEVFYHIYKLQRRNRKRKKKLAAMLARFQESTSAMPDATLVLNSENEIEWFNKAAKQLLGLSKTKDIGQRVDNLVRTPSFVNYMMREEFSKPLEIFSPKNKNTRISISIVGYGKEQKLMIVRDITRLHQLERIRRDFVANVSHELKTPLTVINGYLETAMDSNELDDEHWQKIFELMHQQSVRMQQIVDDLLLLSRLENDDDNPVRDPVAVPALIAAITEDVQALVNEKHQILEIENQPDVWLLGNEKELYSAFSNLIINAVKYTPDSGCINVRWNLSGEDANFEVIDSGIGIAPEHVSRLTERFYRVDTGRSREEGGTGLGLAIVKHALLRHNARLIIKSQPGQGSDFRCVFPADRVLLKESNQVQSL